MSSGWIKLNRKILEWEHYRNANASRVFLHLLLVADYETGTAVVVLNDIAHKLAITHRMVRTAIGNLEKTGEVEVSPQGRNCTEVKIVNWGRYQGGNSNSQTKCQTESQTKCQTKCQTETAYVHGVYEKPCQTESQTESQTNSQTKCQTISTRSKKEVQERSCLVLSDKPADRTGQDTFSGYPESVEAVVEAANRLGYVLPGQEAGEWLRMNRNYGWRGKDGRKVSTWRGLLKGYLKANGCMTVAEKERLEKAEAERLEAIRREKEEYRKAREAEEAMKPKVSGADAVKVLLG